MPEQFLFEQLSAETQVNLRRRLESASDWEPASRPGAARIAVDSTVAMSPGQERIWFVDQSFRNRATFNVVSACEVRGSIDLAALRSAVGRVIKRHEPLRTSLAVVNGDPQQRIRLYSESEIRFRRFPAPELSDRDVHEWLQARSSEPFDLDGDPLLRLDLLSTPADRHILLLTAHHVALDGWSVGVLHRELGHHYAAALGHDPGELPAIRPYAEFSAEQNTARAGEDYVARARRLRAELYGEVGEITPGNLGSPGERGVTATRQLPGELRRLVEQTARDHGTTPFVVFLAAVAVTLRNVFESDLNVVGVPIAGRNDVLDENAIGYYSNTALFPARVAEDASVEDCIGRLAQYSRFAQDHLDVALQDLIRLLGGSAAEGRQPFSALFAYQNVPYTPLQLAGTVTRDLRFSAPVAHAGLTINVWHQAGLAIELEGDSKRFDKTTLEALAAVMECVLRRFADRTQPVRDIPFDGVDQQALAALRREPAAQAVEDTMAVLTRACERPDLLDLWASLLDRTDLTMSSDFFALGGHSLLAAKLIAQVRQRYGVAVPLRSFLKDPTPAGLARFLR